ncbi:hypothetical protein ABFS83_05G123600 [Erythranthe nasuta]
MSNPISTTLLLPETPIAVKRLKHHRHRHHQEMEEENHHHHQQIRHQSLLPGIPDDIAQLCLSLVPPSILYSVCRSWRRLIYAPSFPPFLSLYAVLLPAETHPHASNSVEFSSFDPISSNWNALPPPPSDPPLRFLFRHPSFISRNLPIQTLAVSGNLVVLAATDDRFLPALPHPLVFNPSSEEWARGPPLSTPRRWCAAGAAGGSIYVASGIGSHYKLDVAQSVERWDFSSSAAAQRRRRRRWAWRKMGRLKGGKFSRDAIDAVGWRGKLCMVNVKGDTAKEGTIYDVETDCWGNMPEGMLAGWRGPAAAMEEETIYVVDESRGSLKRYDHVIDEWVEVVEDSMLKGAQQLAAAGGRVCVLCCDGVRIAVVDVAAPPPIRMWVVDAPPGFQVMGIHILPRLSHSD